MYECMSLVQINKIKILNICSNAKLISKFHKEASPNFHQIILKCQFTKFDTVSVFGALEWNYICHGTEDFCAGHQIKQPNCYKLMIMEKVTCSFFSLPQKIWQKISEYQALQPQILN